MKFTDIIGHNKQKNLLTDIVKQQKYASSYAFVGLSGIGKKQLALAFAKAGNCKGDVEFCCDTCPSCLKIEKGNHPDIHILKPDEKNQNIKIEDVRELQRQLAYAPYEAKHRFFIIDNAHCLTIGAANALLKSLEEPAPHTSFILITTSSKKLLPTVISRCQKIGFSPLKTEEVEKFLASPSPFFLSLEGRGRKVRVNEDDTALLARLAQGSIERALNLADSLLSPQKRKKLLQDLENPYSLEWAQNLTEEDLNFLKTWYRDVHVYKTSKKVDDVVNFDLEELLQDQSQNLSADVLIRKQEIVIEAENRLESNANRELTCQWLILSLRNT
ncbi:MAG TPA: DNA polymerase III subunit delta' [Bdellovibrionota bacterium]|nr:DNA polymerase III subunit delta' [Bdellovibrionota bacterium]